MRKEKNDATGTTAAAATTAAEKVLVVAQQQQQESVSENEESDTITDQSSCVSEHKKGALATQFSVQRSDIDGLRMKISAIRPGAAAATAAAATATVTAVTKTTTANLSDKVNNNNCLESLRIKLNNNSSVGGGSSMNSKQTKSSNNEAAATAKLLTTTQLPRAPCLSDATESGCSEATTTTIAATSEKCAKKVKVKRKKAQLKGNVAKSKSNKQKHVTDGNAATTAAAASATTAGTAPSTFSSDSDDEPLQKLKQLQQRAPRLLLTAINTAKHMPLKTLVSLAASTCNDNIALSSSDNELPDLVSAAIKRVESDTDEGSAAKLSSARVKQLPQYQSTLLQDFMEKTQRLSQTPAATPAHHTTPENIVLLSPTLNSDKSASNVTVVTASVATNSTAKKRRGRPKKSTTLTASAALVASSEVRGINAAITAAVTINESADSGVISTTSTTQSTSPSPRLGGSSVTRASPLKNFAELATAAGAAAPKAKIDFVNLDKRMYATERTLYPPPRNKRRQSSGANAEKKASTSTATKTPKEELLDPVWRKIDVNKKFRRPSVSGYKSDGGGGNTTICSKILAAKSGYVSDYGSAHARHSQHHQQQQQSSSGYKSDASGKSRYSARSCTSRRSRAKSCGYRSDCKDSVKSLKSTKFRRKSRARSLLRQQPVGNVTDEQDILQLAGLSLGHSGEESNEYVCKPRLECLPTTSVSKKYGEINRYIATGEYFSRGAAAAATFASCSGNGKSRLFEENASQDGFQCSFSGKMKLLRKNSIGSEAAADVMSQLSRKIKSRRSSAASYCSSYYSGTSRVKRRRRRKSHRFPTTSKTSSIDSKLLTEIDIMTSNFPTLCRIYGGSEKASNALKEKEKLPLGGGKRESRDKRALKKRKLSENIDFALLAASACVGGVGALTPSGGGSGSSGKRRHKKANSSSPDDHKLPLKKRHYLLTPGEKCNEAAAVAAKLFANNAEALAAAAAAAKVSSAASLALPPRYGGKSVKTAITPKKRHLLQNAAHSDDGTASVKSAAASSNCSPLRVCVETAALAGGSKLLDISPMSTGSARQTGGDKKRSRLECLQSKTAATTTTTDAKISASSPQVHSEASSSSSSAPPPGVFEPTVELEIQIPPIAKEAAAIITKCEVDSPLLLELNKSFPLPTTKTERVVETLLNKTGGNLLLKRKRKKINRTGFPTVRRKKRKINAQLLLDVTPDINEQLPLTQSKNTRNAAAATEKVCDRVPQTGEASDVFLQRANRVPPRLSVVSLERLQGPTAPAALQGDVSKQTPNNKRALKKQPVTQPKVPQVTPPVEIKIPKQRGRKPKIALHAMPPQQAKKLADTKTQKDTKVLTPTVAAPQQPPAKPLDPKLNLSCKIRLKRRSLAAAVTDSVDVLKDPHIDCALEHDVLPPQQSNGTSADSEVASDTSDEKSSTASTTTTVARKNAARWKKNYLNAGLFSDYFKCLPAPAALSKKLEKKLAAEKQPAPPPPATLTATTAQGPLLPPPPYCEKYFRRTQQHFELPHDIWWAYKNAKLPARVTVPSWNYRKIRTNVYAESVRPNMAGFDHPTCNCKPDVGCGDDCLNRMVYTECSSSCCPTRDKCRNQKIYRHEVAPGVERFMTDNKGWGVRTKLPINKGTYILEYVGEVVTEREFKDRMGTIYLNDTHHYCLHLDGGLVIDGHRMGSDGRFVNHSCQPNCEMQKWSVNGLSRMALFAARAIAADEELTYDYNFSLFNPSEGQPCRCNTPQCRGVIGGKSQRIKPLPPLEPKPCEPTVIQDARNGRPRKRKAKKNTARLQSKDVVLARVQHLSEKDKKYIKQHAVFLLRNFEKVRKRKAIKQASAKTPPPIVEPKSTTPTPVLTNSTSAAVAASSPTTNVPAKITNRRPSTPASLAAQISALRSPRNMKTRGLALAVQDPELEKMAKMAVVLRDICAALEELKDTENENTKLITLALTAAAPSVTSTTSSSTASNSGGSRKKKLSKSMPKEITLDFATIQRNIEQGFYQQPADFDADMQLLFKQAKLLHAGNSPKLQALATLRSAYAQKKQHVGSQLLELVSEEACTAFVGTAKKPKEYKAAVQPAAKDEPTAVITKQQKEKTPEIIIKPTVVGNASPHIFEADSTACNEDIIRCICGLYKDEGLMIQCARCMVWQHTECTKADINADSYLCERCEPRKVNREIPLEDFTEEGHRYFLSLMRGTLHVRQGDTVYVLRDIPVKDASGKVVPAQKHNYETIGEIEFTECDIFRVERLWKNEQGKRFIFGHHFLRPHETFHEPTRRFYPNEVVRVPLYEVVPIELVIGRCWVLDRTTFCKGRPMECEDDEHCYICELRVDKSARFFSKAKVNYPTCTKSYAFRKFAEKLKISKSYAPHELNPNMLKSKKQKTELEPTAARRSITPVSNRGETNKTPTSVVRKRQSSKSPTPVQVVVTPVVPTLQTIKKKRSHLEVVLKTVKLKTKKKNTQLTNEPALDLSYLLSGRGARQRKSNAFAAVSVNVPV